MIASELNITWELMRIKDGYYGSTTQDGTWNGIIGELHHHRIDLSIVDLSVTSERMQVIYISIKNFRILISFNDSLYTREN